MTTWNTDNEGDTLSIVSVTTPQYGTYVINGQTISIRRSLTGIQKSLYDTFQYTMKDLVGAITSTANIVVTVNPVNDTPVFRN
jgi:aspartate/methionine/tyrosine aminotransferase